MPCKCHIQVYAKDLCRSCYERDLKKRNPEFAERQNQNRNMWTEKNRGYKNLFDSEAQKLRHANDPNYGRSKTARKYGLTLAEYDELMEKPCGICGNPSVHMDHSHDTGKLRGPLCHRCNIALGFLEGWYNEHREAIEDWIA